MQEPLVKARDQIILNPDDLPGSWYNVLADLPGEFPRPKDPEDEPSRLEYLSRVLLKHCLQQEVSTERWIPIPSPVQDLYRKQVGPDLSTARDVSNVSSAHPRSSTTSVRIYHPPDPIRSTQP